MLGFESSKTNNPDTANVFATVKSFNDVNTSPAKSIPNDTRYRFTDTSVAEEESPVPRGHKRDVNPASKSGNSSKDFVI